MSHFLALAILVGVGWGICFDLMAQLHSPTFKLLIFFI